MDNEEWQAFERKILAVVEPFLSIKPTSPKEITTELTATYKALDTALRALKRIEGNTPVKWAIYMATAKRTDGDEVPADPLNIVAGMRELRDIIGFVIKSNKQGRGNSARRSPSAWRKKFFAEVFVLHYRDRFDRWPPEGKLGKKISKTGKAVDLLARIFKAAKEDPESADHCLRKAINKAKSEGWAAAVQMIKNN